MKFLAGVVLTSLLAVMPHGAQSVKYDLPSVAVDTVISLPLPQCDTPRTVTLTARAAAAKSSSSWALLFPTATDTITVSLDLRAAGYFDPFDRSEATVSVAAGARSIGAVTVTDRLATSPGEYNTLTVKISADRINVSGGHRHLAALLDIANPGLGIPSQAFLQASGKVDIASASASVIPLPETVAATAWTEESLRNYLSTAPLDSLEGCWDYLDRNTTPRRAREGGRYSLAIVKSLDRPDTYDILYLSGAAVNAPQWQPAMRKGRLIPTDYIDHYDLEWIDATFVPRTVDIHASVAQSSILTLRFPLLRSSLRFTKRSN